MGDNLVEIGIIVLLVLLNAVFVAAEIALVSIRPSRVEQLVDDGRRGAKRVRRSPAATRAASSRSSSSRSPSSASSPRPSPASASRLALGELVRLMGHELPALPASSACITVTVLLSLFTIVFGELVPKTLALAHPEAFALALAQPVDLIGRVFRPVVAMLTFLTRPRSRACSGPRSRPSRGSPPRSCS